MGRSAVSLVLLALGCLALFPQPDAAAAATAGTASAERSEYVDRLEAICKPRSLATQEALDGVRQDVRQNRIKLAARKFARGTRIFGQTVELMGPVARPPADADVLEKWFVYLHRQEAYLEAITTNLRAERTIKAQRLTARFIHTGNLANDVVLAFGFNYCSFKFSRFG